MLLQYKRKNGIIIVRNSLFGGKKSMFFESEHSLKQDEFVLTRGEGMIFPPHLHRSFEFFGVEDGAAEVVIDEKRVTVRVGEAVLIFPYQLHSYAHSEACRHVMLIFSQNVVSSFARHTAGLLPEENRFPLPALPMDAPQNPFAQKAMAYAICGRFEEGARYRKKAQDGRDDLLTEMLLYAGDHFTSACLLRDAARRMQYDYVYMSKFFRRRMGIPFHAYVNRLRVEEACRLLRTTGESVQRISELCGFSSERTFHRVFKQLTLMTPAAYKNAP